MLLNLRHLRFTSDTIWRPRAGLFVNQGTQFGEPRRSPNAAIPPLPPSSPREEDLHPHNRERDHLHIHSIPASQGGSFCRSAARIPGTKGLRRRQTSMLRSRSKTRSLLCLQCRSSTRRCRNLYLSNCLRPACFGPKSRCATHASRQACKPALVFPSETRCHPGNRWHQTWRPWESRESRLRHLGLP